MYSENVLLENGKVLQLCETLNDQFVVQGTAVYKEDTQMLVIQKLVLSREAILKL